MAQYGGTYLNPIRRFTCKFTVHFIEFNFFYINGNKGYLNSQRRGNGQRINNKCQMEQENLKPLFSCSYITIYHCICHS